MKQSIYKKLDSTSKKVEDEFQKLKKASKSGLASEWGRYNKQPVPSGASKLDIVMDILEYKFSKSELKAWGAYYD